MKTAPDHRLDGAARGTNELAQAVPQSKTQLPDRRRSHGCLSDLDSAGWMMLRQFIAVLLVFPRRRG
jgi:hypothetical protein